MFSSHRFATRAFRFVAIIGLLAFGGTAVSETLTSIPAGQPAPQNAVDLWNGFDPQADPLDVEVLHEWEQDEVSLKVIRYCVGTFKGQKSMIAAIYGHPKGAENLPGLVHIHGGGQYADSNAVLTNARRGYATLSISWAGRLTSPEYRVSPNQVKLFWDNKTEDPNYKLTTDWGALDGYHAPSRFGKDTFTVIPIYDWSLDAVKSPRNNSWFLGAMAARRGLTFLEQQPEVDGDKLGVYGHSMGGKLTVLTAASDNRVKAAAPSCGGISDRSNKDPLHHQTVGDSPNLSRIACPIFFLKPSNDFHALVQDLPTAISEIGSKEWRITSSPHINHQDIPPHEVATQLWFDQHLKGTFSTPQTPQLALQLETSHGSPVATITPDTSRKVQAVEVYYTQHLTQPEDREVHDNAINRVWHYAPAASPDEEDWFAQLPLASTDQPLWVYANVLYALDEPISGADYYHSDYTADSFNISSLIQIVPGEKIQAAGCQAKIQGGKLIEDFNGLWHKEWFSLKAPDWGRTTRKLAHPHWQAPTAEAGLAIRVRSVEPNTLAIRLDKHAAEVQLKGGNRWQTFHLQPEDFTNAASEPLAGWADANELELTDTVVVRGKDKQSLTVGKPWQGAPPEFQNLWWDTAYRWTTDHMHVGVRWQPHAGKPLLNAYDATRPVINRDSSYAQFWVSWGAMEPNEDNRDYINRPSSSMTVIEQAVDDCVARGIKVEFVFFHAPAWATESGKSGGHRPKAGLYPKFIERIATHFKGRVDAYQLSHEANNQSLMKGADMDFIINEILLEGGRAVRRVYEAEPALPVIVSTSGCSPCQGCPTMEGLGGTIGGEAANTFYNLLISSPELMEAVDALNLNISDTADGYGNMDGSYISSVWSNYDLVRGKLDDHGLADKSVLAAESWISWDDGRPAVDVNGDGLKNEHDAYDKAVTILGQCMERGLNTINLPWCDNSSSWAMGLTKRRDYNGKVATLKPPIVIPANDGGPGVITEKVQLQGTDAEMSLGTLGEKNDIFTVDDYINPSDPVHLHYYIWRWYGQIASQADEVIRHAVAGEIGNDIAVRGGGFTGAERYRLASYNRTRNEFTVLIYAGGARGQANAIVKIPSTIQTGEYYNNDFSKIDFRGEGFADGDIVVAHIETKDISRDDGSDVDPIVYTTAPTEVKEGNLMVNIKKLKRFTTIRFVKQ